MLKKIIYATVVYSCKAFDVYLRDYLESVFMQSDKYFEVLILIDDADTESVRKMIEVYNSGNRPVHIYTEKEKKTPVALRKQLIDLSHGLGADVLVFSDFDENVALNRVEEVRKNIDNYAFAFNDFYIVDNNLQRMHEKSFFSERDIPKVLSDWRDIRSFNYVGLGSMALNLAVYNYAELIFPDNIEVLDWFIATKVLLDGGNGISLKSTYANYRQHEDSFVGFNFKLTEAKLEQGLRVKKNHYMYFKDYKREFNELYLGIQELELFIENIGANKYIDIINSNFDTEKFCWWENIKLVKEISHVI